MDLREVINKINTCADEMDFATARVYIEENIESLEPNKQMLKRNARDLFDFIKTQQNGEIQALTRKDMAIINAINSYASKFDVRGMKFLIKENTPLILRHDVTPYFNSDAKTIMAGMKL